MELLCHLLRRPKEGTIAHQQLGVLAAKRVFTGLEIADLNIIRMGPVFKAEGITPSGNNKEIRGKLPTGPARPRQQGP